MKTNPNPRYIAVSVPTLTAIIENARGELGDAEPQALAEYILGAVCKPARKEKGRAKSRV